MPSSSKDVELGLSTQGGDEKEPSKSRAVFFLCKFEKTQTHNSFTLLFYSSKKIQQHEIQRLKISEKVDIKIWREAEGTENHQNLWLCFIVGLPEEAKSCCWGMNCFRNTRQQGHVSF
jgi:hypothetical protein